MKKLFFLLPFLLAPQLALAGSQTYSSPGTYTFAVPAYGSLTVTVNGAGGGGGGGAGNGASGGQSSFYGIIAGGGGGGIGGPNFDGKEASQQGAGGSGGSASGGDVNTSGSSGQSSPFQGLFNGGDGGASPNGGAGGAGGVLDIAGGSNVGQSGNLPGGGGGGGGSPCANCYKQGGGGGGGYASKTYSQGALPGSVTVVVGGGGGNGGGSQWGYAGGSGAPGRVSITWTDPSPPTCSISVDQNPINQPGGTTLRWSSANADWFYITNVSYVTPNQSASTSVAPSQTTTYNGTVSGPGGSGSCSVTLTVNRSCTFNGQTITHGNSVTAYQASTVPYGSSCSSQTRTCNDGTLSGSYQYSSCSVNSPANCSLDGVTVNHGESRTFYSVQTAPSGELCSFATYSQSRACTDGSLSGSASFQYASCSCTPTTVYSCSAETIVRTVTNSSCSVTVTNPYATCVSPAFCSSGSAVCLYPPPSYNAGADGLDGHLEIRPNIVPTFETALVYWDLSNVSSCSVTGGNGDAWSGASSGASGQETSPILEPTTYTLACEGLDGSTITESVTVQVVPIFQEL
ncbi:hypothetical protein A3C21_00820 [Candidatus Kaiserbacteria bacterium RIFCSPHIGHO2_02_FULL_59_21]|uniref:Ig-like domain-containing protein n=1 Tax=Candidatus Kaiserbacteria bacterium RIFCSPHIGHO2_02_FULL_59_21 TaxID=1798500 RepID=A0A1F6E0Q5_9BACT|nr:MAG: hypothetical protein A2766_00090 [Candidatus Kaiserbacteria bacterium RIFCSPHIGHO2_01_FULL_58_22]OGG67284.1 MAG: hypothetical protein A3C21_00820 [Candidatus Kaiserbacteria bacterium RIFCSPHIGHO2_02_FULL_59_21]OGG86407.1 MAG: hypothetical protein A3I47_04390 [Candidatus Kaiserbacteria bacterium RIFCSPLOWO2_02_FULL_59_19]